MPSLLSAGRVPGAQSRAGQLRIPPTRDHRKAVNHLSWFFTDISSWEWKTRAPSTGFTTPPSAPAFSQNDQEAIVCLSSMNQRPCTKGEQCLYSSLIIFRTCSNNSAFLESPSFISTGFLQDPGSFPWLASPLPLEALCRYSLAPAKCSTESLFLLMNVFVLPPQMYYTFPQGRASVFSIHYILQCPWMKIFLPGCH